jgi:putative ABC transport system permease protein
MPLASYRPATPDYFLTLGIPLVAGRGFTQFDNEKAPQVAIISGSLARHRWPNQDPIGRRVTFDQGRSWVQIVGVVGDVKEESLAREAPDQFYVPLAQNPMPHTVLVRTAGDPAAAAGLVRRAILTIDPETAITGVQTLEQARSDAVSSPRTTARLFSLYSSLAFVIALAGIGFMLGLWVRQRTREIGIRMAMGARPGAIAAMVMRQGMVLITIGLAVGLAGALAVTRLLRKLLFQVTPTDSPTYMLITALLVAAALAACYLPARRAARIDPQTALRCE